MKKILSLLCGMLLSASVAAQTFTVNNLAINGTFTSGAVVGLTSLKTQAANSVVANVTGSTASPTAFVMPSCSTSSSALQWTNGTGFVCNTAINAATLGTFSVGTAGSFIPLLSGANTWSGLQTFSSGLTVSGGAITGITGRLLAVQVFSASGTYTPTSGTTKAILRVQAPGGGSGGTTTTGASTISISSAGSAGSYYEGTWASPTTQTVTIGATGTAGAAAGAGGNGGTTSIGSVVSCPGGLGGAAGAATAPPFVVAPAASPAACTVSGTVTVFTITGSRGQFGHALSTTAADLPTGGPGTLGSTTYGVPTGYGSGASGAQIGLSATGAAGFAAAPGVIIVYDYQ